MNHRQTPSALRQWRAHMGRPTTLAGLAGAGVILGFAGPFDTDEVMRLVPRIVYWAALVLVTYGVGAGVSVTLEPRLMERPLWLRVPLISIATGLGVSMVVLGMNYAVFAFAPELTELPEFLGAVFAITLTITAVSAYADSQRDKLQCAENAPSNATPKPPALLDRVPLDKRGALLALSVEDHYVHVRTTAGTEMLLMRLSDAIRETAPIQGAQVHRSHWVALDQVASARRRGDGAVLTLNGGTEIPVSRANLPKIKDAGLLPRS